MKGEGGSDTPPFFLNRNTSCLCQNPLLTRRMTTRNARCATLSCILRPVALRPVMPVGG